MQPVWPQSLFKILTLAQWKEGQEKKILILGDQDETFIHLAEEHQVVKIAKKFFKDQSQVVIIELDRNKLVGRLIKERNPGGETKYFHLYDGHLPFNAIIQTSILNLNN